MAKPRTYYSCRHCGYQSASWLGRCPECGQFGTFDEEVAQASSPSRPQVSAALSSVAPQRLSEVTAASLPRLSTASAEFDRVLGGGIVPGSLLLIGGEPGIGKSTLLLQSALAIPNLRILYVSGEESEQQIKLRADRLGPSPDGLFVVSETLSSRIFEHIDAVKPQLLIVDSIQTVTSPDIESPAGSVSQIRQCTTEFLHYAKRSGVPVLLVGHITKDGTLAGPKVMEHIVDAVLQFEGDRNYGFRILRAAKNRFGSTSEIGIFEMQAGGLREVANPSQYLLSRRDTPLSGAVVAGTLEGARPMFVEVQSLVSAAVYGTPQRNAGSFDSRRFNMLLALLEKRCGIKLSTRDVFLNLAGGIRIADPALDLAVCCAVISSFLDLPVAPHYCFAGELGLGGEVRPVRSLPQRISEAARLGFQRIYLSRSALRSLPEGKEPSIAIHPVDSIDEVFKSLFRS